MISDIDARDAQKLKDAEAERNRRKANVISSCEEPLQVLLSLCMGNMTKPDIAQILAIVAAIAQQQRSPLPSANLSADPPAIDNAHWQGRDREIRQLQQWLMNPKVTAIAIRGACGVGKSWLAARLFETFQDFEAKLWVDASQNPDFAAFAQKALSSLAAKSPNDFINLREPSQLINELLKSLKQRRCLLVIDNLETLLDEQRHFIPAYKDFFQRWLESETTSVLLLTTQIQPEILETRCRWLNLQGLEATEGSQLLHSFGIEGSDAHLQALTNRLNGYPKLLCLVAAFLKTAGTFHIREAETLGLQSLDAELDRLHQPSLKRQQVQFVWLLEQHWQRMTPELQNFLANLSLYRQPFDRALAVAVLGKGDTPSSPLTAALALQELMSCSLMHVISGNQKYQFHPFVWQYLQHKAIAPLKAIASENIVAYYQAIAAKDKNWKILEDIADYLEIFYYQCLAKQFTKALETLNFCDDFLNGRGYKDLRIELFDFLVKSWESSNGEKKKFAEAIARLARACLEFRKYSKAVECCQQGLKVVQKVGDRATEADLLHCLSRANYHQKQYQKAIECDDRALKIFRELDDRARVSATLINLGNNYCASGKYEQAIDLYHEAREVAVSAGLNRWEAAARNGLGNIYYSLEQYEPAIEFYQQALVLYREMGDRKRESLSLSRLGDACYALGQYQRAITRLEQSLDIKRKIGYSQGVANSLTNLGKAYHALGEYKREIDCYQQLLEIKQDAGNLPGVAKALEQLWLVYLGLQEHEQALYYYLNLQEIKQKITEIQGETDSLEQLGLALDALENNGPKNQ